MYDVYDDDVKKMEGKRAETEMGVGYVPYVCTYLINATMLMPRTLSPRALAEESFRKH